MLKEEDLFLIRDLYYDTAQKEVLFPFGFGLSYTSFTYSDLKISAPAIAEDETLTVSFKIKNSGDCDGAEVAQLYVRDLSTTNFVPAKELRAFQKVFLKKGETKTVTLDLNRDAFAFIMSGPGTGAWKAAISKF